MLVVEDDMEMRRLVEEELRDAGYEVRTAAGGDEALADLEGADVVVTDLVMPGMRGEELLARVRSRDPELPVLVMTAFGSIDSAVEVIKAGAFTYIAKPCRMDQLLESVAAALGERRVRRALHGAADPAGSRPPEIVCESPGMKRAVELVLRAAPADVPVLLLGESGTGKELLARALHERSARREGPFVAVNCSAIPEPLLESQLFGHLKGSFTDAREDRAGLFRQASGGTILLDEIGDMPLALQAKLLRVLQEGEVHPIGAPAPIAVDARIAAATNRDLESLAREGTFRRDLYYRLNVVAVRIPPLRERPEDLLPLVGHFLRKHADRHEKGERTVSSEALEALRRHAWPGNARELENAIERAMVLGRESVLRLEDLPEAVRRGAPVESLQDAAIRPLEEVERQHIFRVLGRVQGNKAAAARLLGMDRKTLYRKLESYSHRAD